MTEATTIPTTEAATNNKMKPGDLLSFITVALTISAAVFYIAGWIYEAHWYGFFGINITQINIPLQQIMIEGLPGIFIIAISLLVANVIFSIRRMNKKNDPKNLDVLRTILIAYSISIGFILSIGIYNRKFLNPLPLEIIISSAGLVIVFFILILLQLIRNNRMASILKASSEITPVLLNLGIMNIMVGGLISASIPQSLLSEIMKTPKFKALIKKSFNRAEPIVIAIINAWRIWIGLVILFFVFLSLTTSAILGRVDAHYGKRFMMGGWKMNETYIYSSKPNLPLPHSSNPSADKGYTYGPFGLIANDEQAYYLVDWKIGDYYEFRPNLYILPRTNDASFIILYVPQPTPIPTVTMTPLPTATPLPASATPTP